MAKAECNGRGSRSHGWVVALALLLAAPRACRGRPVLRPAAGPWATAADQPRRVAEDDSAALSAGNATTTEALALPTGPADPADPADAASANATATATTTPAPTSAATVDEPTGRRNFGTALAAGMAIALVCAAGTAAIAVWKGWRAPR